MWYAGSDVMGCRRPTGGVFSYVSSDRVTLRAFPVATPRGRSSSSHEGESLISHFYNYVGGVRPPDKRKGSPLCSDKNRQDVMSFSASE